ncbi:MAG: GNAT family N-acetyltransferase [Acidobacteriota bacterium]|nr:GNAT family N-acetyltransferase [Acidobacteriota bacterium]
MAPPIKSLVWATDIDVLEADHTLQRRDGYWVVQSPRNATYWWGNFLLFDAAPVAGDGERWQRLFAAEFGARPEVTHRTLAWDCIDGESGAAEQELVARGYELEWTAGLTARPDALRAHPAANAEVEVRALDAAGDELLWEAVLAVQLAGAKQEFQGSDYHLNFSHTRLQQLREILRGGRGSWYVAVLGDAVVGSLGIVVTGSRARFQSVDTLAEHRRRGIARRLVVDAARDALSHHEIEHFVIAADPDYHALGIYEGLGFERAELVVGAMRKPDDQLSP